MALNFVNDVKISKKVLIKINSQFIKRTYDNKDLQLIANFKFTTLKIEKMNNLSYL